MDQERITIVEKARALCNKMNFDYNALADYLIENEEEIPTSLSICVLNFAFFFSFITQFNFSENEINEALDILESCLIFDLDKTGKIIAEEVAFSNRYKAFIEQGLVETPQEYLSKEEYAQVVVESLSYPKEFNTFYYLLKNLSQQYSISFNDLYTAINIWISTYHNESNATTSTNVALYWLKGKFPQE